MDAAQIQICKALKKKDSYGSVLNSQKKSRSPSIAVFSEQILLLHDGNDHWLLTFFSNGRVQVCDSLINTLGKCVNALYREGKIDFIVSSSTTTK